METVIFRREQGFGSNVKEFFRYLPEFFMILVAIALGVIGLFSLLLVSSTCVIGVLSALSKKGKWWKW